jgi:hypothetical protein
MCDDPMPANALGDGMAHKWGDIDPECADPNFKGPVDIIRGGLLEQHD